MKSEVDCFYCVCVVLVVAFTELDTEIGSLVGPENL